MGANDDAWNAGLLSYPPLRREEREEREERDERRLRLLLRLLLDLDRLRASRRLWRLTLDLACW